LENRLQQVPFQDQIETLVDLGYPALLGVEPQQFRQALEPLRTLVPASAPGQGDLDEGILPYVLVVDCGPHVGESLRRVTRRNRGAVESLHPKRITDFQAIEGLDVPEAAAYLLVGVDRGHDTLNVTPDDALRKIRGRGRQPLTIEEGIAVLTHYPEYLQPNKCFSLLGSRCADKRVPALWLSEGRPKLGWCWAGNPHTWLGSASCTTRVGAALPSLAADPDARRARGRASLS
jgi:hypothetical protein